MKIYRIEICASNDKHEFGWGMKKLTDFFTDKNMAEMALSKYNAMTREELEEIAKAVSIRNNRPQLVEYELKECESLMSIGRARKEAYREACILFVMRLKLMGCCDAVVEHEIEQIRKILEG